MRRMWREEYATEARRLRELGYTWREVGKAMGWGEETVRARMTGEYDKRVHRSGYTTRRNREIPAPVLAEWRRRGELEPASLTAALMGDPLPPYSALAKKQQERDSR